MYFIDRRKKLMKKVVDIKDKRSMIKHRMEEFILTVYWFQGKNVRYKDIKEKFHLYCSEGCIVNYLQELQDEKKIQKFRNNDIIYYGPPKIKTSIKYIVISTILLPLYSVPLHIFHDKFWYGIIFYIGSIITACFWRKTEQ